MDWLDAITNALGDTNVSPVANLPVNTLAGGVASMLMPTADGPSNYSSGNTSPSDHTVPAHVDSAPQEEEDPYAPKISAAMGTLQNHYKALEDSMKQQFATPYPTPARATLGTKDLIWAIPALLAATGAIGGKANGPGLAAGIFGGAMQGKQQDVADTNKQNMGIYNQALQRAQANTQAEQVGVNAAQADLTGLEGQQKALNAAILGRARLNGPELNNIRTALTKAPPSQRAGLMAQANALRPGTYTQDQIDGAGALTPSDLKTLGQAELYSEHGAVYRSSAAYIDTKNDHEKLLNTILSAQAPDLMAQPGIKNDMMLQQAKSLAQRTIDYHTKVSSDVALAQSREALNAKLASVVVPKAQAYINHMNEIPAEFAQKLDLETRKAIAQTYDRQTQMAQQAVTSIGKTVAGLREQAQFASGDDKAKMLAAADKLESTDLKSAQDALSGISVESVQSKFKLGIDPTGGAQKPQAQDLKPLTPMSKEGETGLVPGHPGIWKVVGGQLKKVG